MALSRQLATERKLNAVSADKQDLEKDIEGLEKTLARVGKKKTPPDKRAEGVQGKPKQRGKPQTSTSAQDLSGNSETNEVTASQVNFRPDTLGHTSHPVAIHVDTSLKRGATGKTGANTGASKDITGAGGDKQPTKSEAVAKTSSKVQSSPKRISSSSVGRNRKDASLVGAGEGLADPPAAAADGRTGAGVGVSPGQLQPTTATGGSPARGTGAPSKATVKQQAKTPGINNTDRVSDSAKKKAAVVWDDEETWNDKTTKNPKHAASTGTITAGNRTRTNVSKSVSSPSRTVSDATTSSVNKSSDKDSAGIASTTKCKRESSSSPAGKQKHAVDNKQSASRKDDKIVGTETSGQTAKADPKSVKTGQGTVTIDGADIGALDPKSQDDKIFVKRKPSFSSGSQKPQAKRAQSAKSSKAAEAKSTNFEKRSETTNIKDRKTASLDEKLSKAKDKEKPQAENDLELQDYNEDSDGSIGSAKGPADGQTNKKKTKILKKMMGKMDLNYKLREFKVAEKQEKESINLASRQRSFGGPSDTAVRSRLPVQAISKGQRSPSKVICDPEVALWLRGLNLKDVDRYITIFCEHEVDMECLLMITEHQLKEMGIKAIGAYNKILQAIRDLQKQREEDRLARETEERLNLSGESSRSDGDSVDGDRGSRSKILPIQTNKAVQLRQNLMQTKQQRSVRKPWMNPNRNTSVKSKIDTGLNKAEDKLGANSNTPSPPRPVTDPPRGPNVQYTGHRLTTRPNVSRSFCEDPPRLRFVPRNLTVHQDIEPLAGRTSNQKRSPTSSAKIPDIDECEDDLRQDPPSYMSYLSDNDSDNEVIMKVDIRRHSASRENISDILPSNVTRADRRRSDGETIKSSDTVPTFRKKPPVAAPKQANPRKSVCMGVAQFGLLQDSKDTEAVSLHDVTPSPGSSSQTPMTSRATSAGSTTSRADNPRKSIAETNDALVDIEMQLQNLHGNTGDGTTVATIQQLQAQVAALQQQMASQVPSQAAPSTKRVNSARKPDTLGLTGIAGTSSRPQTRISPQDETRKAHSLSSDDGSVVVSDEAQKERTSPSVPSAAQQPISAAMKKQDILKEVRKQREDYRKQIRHLEGELSRLKHKDPMRAVEVKESEVLWKDSDLIGEGAFSQVFRGSFHGCEAAIKRLKVPLLAQDKNYFMAEVSLMRELRHPRVVLLLGVCTTAQRPLMVLEYLPKGSLYYYLHDTDIASLDHLAYYQIARDMALGMTYLHQHRPCVLHLDLKSMNVLLTQHLRAKIADFGFSKLRHDANEVAHKSQPSAGKAAGIQGTPAWMAPELFNGGNITTKCDVYSFGVILWEMFTRQHPYHGCSMFQIMERVRKGTRPEIPQSCPQPLTLVISRCWNQNPTRRPAFRDVVPMLERLHFPPEWRALFAAAGVPPAALEDIQSTRTLVDLVAHSLETEQVTKLRQEHMRESDSGRGVSVSPPLPRNPPTAMTVTEKQTEVAESGEVEDSEFGDHESGVFEESRPSSEARSTRTPSVPSIYDSLEAMHQATSATVAMSQILEYVPPALPPPSPLVASGQILDFNPPPIEKPAFTFDDLYDSSIVAQHDRLANVVGPAPPPPPPPPPLPPPTVLPPLAHNNANFTHDPSFKLKPSSEGIDSDHDGSESNLPSFMPSASHLSQQKMKLKPLETSNMPQLKSSDYYINPADLMSQKCKLKPIPTPAPSQLQDLSEVGENRLHSIADILKKAMGDRRILMNAEADSLDQSMTSVMWSVTDD